MKMNTSLNIDHITCWVIWLTDSVDCWVITSIQINTMLLEREIKKSFPWHYLNILAILLQYTWNICICQTGNQHDCFPHQLTINNVWFLQVRLFNKLLTDQIICNSTQQHWYSDFIKMFLGDPSLDRGWCCGQGRAGLWGGCPLSTLTCLRCLSCKWKGVTFWNFWSNLHGINLWHVEGLWNTLQ